MLVDPPNQPDAPLDFSLLNSRIQDLKEVTTPSQKNLARSFVKNTLLPILTNPKINEEAKHPKFLNDFTELLVSFLTTAPQVMAMFDEP